MNGGNGDNLIDWLKSIIRGRPAEANEHEVLEDYLTVPESYDSKPLDDHERTLLTNILNLRAMTVVDVMIPRAEIVAIDIETPADNLLSFLTERQFSRYPVYRGTLDEVLGTIHIKDIIACIARGISLDLTALTTAVPIVSPSMSLLDLLLKMRQTRRHIALIVDEYGGVDGLVTIGDIIESIVGQIDDEHDNSPDPQFTRKPDGSVLADARLGLEDFEVQFGKTFLEEEHAESDTLGGLCVVLAGRIPARGEILTHSTGLMFEILDADPRRVNLLRIRNLPSGE